MFMLLGGNTCHCSQANENRLNKLNEKFSSQGYHVVAINSNDPDVSPKDSFKKMKERAKEQKFNFPYFKAGIFFQFHDDDDSN